MEGYKEIRGDTNKGNEEGDRIWNRTLDLGYELELKRCNGRDVRRLAEPLEQIM